MLCICRLREVKLTSRSVTSSTCGTKVTLFPVPGHPGPPTTLPPQAWDTGGVPSPRGQGYCSFRGHVRRRGSSGSTSGCAGGGWPGLWLTCSLVLVIWRRLQRSSSRSRCSCRPRRSRYSRSMWMICRERALSRLGAGGMHGGSETQGSMASAWHLCSPASPLAARPPGTGSGPPAGCSAWTWPGVGACGLLDPGHPHGLLQEQAGEVLGMVGRGGEGGRGGDRGRGRGGREGASYLLEAAW